MYVDTLQNFSAVVLAGFSYKLGPLFEIKYSCDSKNGCSVFSCSRLLWQNEKKASIF